MSRRTRSARILNKLGKRSIVLVGMMGCGKSAIGSMLANRLGIEFNDADAEIEKAAGRSVADIFAEYGEAEFRRLEQKVIARLIDEGPMVLALVGGAFVNEDTREVVSKNGLSVWFNVDIDTLFERVMRKPGKRPLLLTDDPKKTLAGLMEKREPVYSLANLHVGTVPGTKTNMRDHVMRSLDEFLAKHEFPESAQ